MYSAYFDYAASSPMDKRVLNEIKPYFQEKYGNPSSLYSLGRESMRIIQKARSQVAHLINADEKSLIFTSCASESNNWALKGVVSKRENKGKKILISAVEHTSIISPCEQLEKQGFTIEKIPVSKEGLIDIEILEELLTSDTIFVSIQAANSEMGTIQDIKTLSKLIHDKVEKIIFHVDAVAALGKIPIDVKDWNVDLLTISSNEIYGPKGIAALYKKQGTPLERLITGGGQEMRLRAGTENVPGIVGFGAAAELTQNEMNQDNNRLRPLRDKIIQSLTTEIPYCFLNGHSELRLPTNASVRINFIEGESLLLNLEMEGISAATGSACAAKSLEPSHVLLAMGIPHEEAHGSLVLNLGKPTTSEEVDHLLSILPDIIHKLRMMSPLTPPELLKE
ncbi:MAG: cysteine desulfurase family protein [Promethearchaeota archaeon]